MDIETIKRNEKFAEFLGMQSTNIGWYDDQDALPEILFDLNGGNTYDTLHFHESWDWLMSVVNNIRSLYNNTIVVGERVQEIIDDLAEGCVETNILQVNSAVDEFIDWYKENVTIED